MKNLGLQSPQSANAHPMLPLLKAMRPHQWVKNGLVLAPLLFAHKLDASESVLAATVALAVFCALSSSVYLLNDILDRDADRKHPTKCKRPIAAGDLGLTAAIWAGIALLMLATAGTVHLSALHPNPSQGPQFWVWPTLYLGMNVAYSLGLKRRVIIDCLCIALGFQFRVQAGSAAIDVDSSKWILLCTFFFALFLAFCKRREELARCGDSSGRATMRAYTLPFLDQLIAPLAALSILTYALYTMDTETSARHDTQNMMFTVPFVVFGVFRYLFLIHVRGGGEDPARLLFRDRQLVLSGVLWMIAVLLILS